MNPIDGDKLQEVFREECACECACCLFGIFDKAEFKGCKLIKDAPTIKDYSGWIKVKDQLPVVPEGKELVDVLVVAKVYFTPDHNDQRDWTYVVEKATYEPKYGFYGNNIRNYNVKEWMYAPQMPKRYERYVWREEE